MIHFSFAPLGLMEKLIALLSGRPSPLAAYSTIPYTPLHTFTLSVSSLFISSFLFSAYVRKRNTSGYARRKQRNVFPHSQSLPLVFVNSPSETFSVYLLCGRYRVRWDITSVSKPIPCTGSFHSSGDQTMWLNKQVRA